MKNSDAGDGDDHHDHEHEGEAAGAVALLARVDELLRARRHPPARAARRR